MAGKVKKKDDGAVLSKTARASTRGSAGGKEAYIPSGDVARIVPLGGGTHAYILDPRNGRTVRVAVASEKFVEVLGALDEAGFGDRMRRDLADLANRYPQGGWAAAQARIDAANGAAEEVSEEVPA